MENLRNKLSLQFLNIAVKLAVVNHKAGITTDGCFRTFTRKKFNILHPTDDMIDIEDIAKGLAYKPHFSGFSPRFFSIAEHCLLVEQLMSSYHEQDYCARLEALLHDASEAYTGDMIKPIKNLLPNFVVIEKNIQKAIYAKYNIKPMNYTLNVKFFDNKAQDIEAGIFFDLYDTDRKKMMQHLINYYSPDAAYRIFLTRFNFLVLKIKEGSRNRAQRFVQAYTREHESKGNNQ